MENKLVLNAILGDNVNKYFPDYIRLRHGGTSRVAVERDRIKEDLKHETALLALRAAEKREKMLPRIEKLRKNV